MFHRSRPSQDDLQPLCSMGSPWCAAAAGQIPDELMLDSCDVRAHRAGGTGEVDTAAGVSQGGRTTKIHCLVDTCGRDVAYPLNRSAYRRRNIIERMFGKLKNWLRIAMRYNRLAVVYFAAIALHRSWDRRCQRRRDWKHPRCHGHSASKLSVYACAYPGDPLQNTASLYGGIAHSEEAAWCGAFWEEG